MAIITVSFGGAFKSNADLHTQIIQDLLADKSTPPVVDGVVVGSAVDQLLAKYSSSGDWNDLGIPGDVGPLIKSIYDGRSFFYNYLLRLGLPELAEDNNPKPFLLATMQAITPGLDLSRVGKQFVKYILQRFAGVSPDPAVVSVIAQVVRLLDAEIAGIPVDDNDYIEQADLIAIHSSINCSVLIQAIVNLSRAASDSAALAFQSEFLEAIFKDTNTSVLTDAGDALLGFINSSPHISS